jgi:hypothetical protein
MFNPVKWIWGMERVLDLNRRPQHLPPDDEFFVGETHRPSRSLRIDTIIEFGGGLGANDVSEKRPNLETITKKVLDSCGHPAAYLPAINAPTVIRAAHFFNALNTIRDAARDQPITASRENLLGSPVDEQWFHLHVVEDPPGVIATASARNLLTLVQELALSHVVQVIGESPEEHAELFDSPRTAAERLEPCLEIIVGCQTAAILQTVGERAIAAELQRLRARLEHPGYGPLSVAATGDR